jgi:protoheme IX farnesyltransferase
MATKPVLPAPPFAVLQPRHGADVAAWSDYCALTKPDVNILIAITVAVAFCMAVPPSLSSFPSIALLNAVFGTMLVAAGAATLNQWMERRFDAQMRRTGRRPIAAGRIEPFRALAFGTLVSLAGTAFLVVTSGVLAALLAVITLASYLLVYTPLKRRTPLCTLIGAIPGAMPPLIGWAAARGALSAEAWLLFAIVFLWQFPHFMAIGWMYREDYDRAGYKVLPQGRARVPVVILQTLLPLIVLAFVNLLPTLTGTAGVRYAAGVLLLGFGFLAYGLEFVERRSGASARRLLLVSILYLPLVFLIVSLA